MAATYANYQSAIGGTVPWQSIGLAQQAMQTGLYNPVSDSWDRDVGRPNMGALIEPSKQTKKGENMITEIAKDAKAFIKEHKSLLYWVATLFVVDHFFFHGAFKEKLRDIMQKLVGKAEDKINKLEL